MKKRSAFGIPVLLAFQVTVLLPVSLPAADPPAWVERLAFWTAPVLETLRAEIAARDAELAALPVLTNVNSGNRSGFQTTGQEGAADAWLELELPAAAAEEEVQEVVLVPLLARASGGPVAGFGFPRRFLLEGFDVEGEPVTLMDETGQDFPNPGTYPVSALCPPGLRLRRFRLTAVGLAADGDPGSGAVAAGPGVLALSEMLLLRGSRNLALKAKVRASSSREIPPTWSRANLTDMVLPLGLPVKPGGSGMLGWQSAPVDSAEREISVTVDLGALFPLEEIRLIPASRGSMVWDSYYGFPLRFRMETSMDADFTAARQVLDRRGSSLMSPGQNMQCFSLPGESARFVRVTASRLRGGEGGFVFALGELQVWSGERNVAAGAAVKAETSVENAEWSPRGLTDGQAGGGILLDLPDWIHQLRRRRLAGEERAALQARRIQVLASAEHALLAGSMGGAGAIVLLAAGFTWRGHRQRARERELHRERLARDLHDELGSNLGSIALISSFAAREPEEQMRQDLAEIERVARESADSMRDMVSLLGARRGAEADWLAVLGAMAARLMRGVELECRLPSSPLEWEPDLETRRELYLFAKEVLHNAARHGRPEHVVFEISPSPEGLRLRIQDDGRGFQPGRETEGQGLGNLRERAAGMRAEMSLVSTPGQGVTVRLHLTKTRRWNRR